MSDRLMAVANALVSACRNNESCLDTLYAEDAVSVEAAAAEGQPRIRNGRDAIRAKHEWWSETFETHSNSVDGPYPHGDDRFAVVFQSDTSNRATGERVSHREIAVYHVQDGLICREEFFYQA
ncbi:nuclear transport factor 2 family protein [Profundibacterium mesophilum]|uniref:SnoaL-like domain containing protein n=1 Tax=Profundibacterium mesophilum KAUST100406-0324 TaxID=1037889 RepID=A0A921NTG1_9RHOB|nr:SnoaL-like domain-containing protein [Profundibacterium mesophilum]KAF0674846.1 SnoaL-like domain containing protein [Profundibacterium mesophilum KAUST100406-0324]